MVYVAPPMLTSFPGRYTIRFGYVIQGLLATGNWPGAIQNVTMPEHYVYPGTISRVVTSTSAGPNIFTHGIGHNLVGTFNAPPGIPSQPINMILACANDIWGPKAFETLDKQAIKYWQENIASQQLIMPLGGDAVPGMEAIGLGQ